MQATRTSRILGGALLACLILAGCSRPGTVERLVPYRSDQGDQIARELRATFESRFYELDISSQAHFAVRIHRSMGSTAHLDAVAADTARRIDDLRHRLEGLGEEGFVEAEGERAWAAKREVSEVLRARKEMFSTREEMLFHRSVLYAAHKLRDHGLHEGPYRTTYEAALRHLKGVDWPSFLLDPEVIRPYAAQTSNLVYWLKRLGTVDLEEEYTRVFREVFMEDDDERMTAADYQNKLYGLTHFIIGDSHYYQRMVSPEKHRWILDYFDRHILEILSWSKPDIIAEIALSYKLCGLADQRAARLAEEYVAEAFDPELGLIPSEAGSADLDASEHRNVLAYLVLSDWERLHEGPTLSADAVQAFVPEEDEVLEASFSLPSRGEEVPELRPFDRAMTSYMRRNGITAGLLGVMKDGEVILQRSYGWRDSGRKKPLPPNALMRVASLTKLFTAAAIRRLAASGAISYDDRVFDLDGDGKGLLDIEPFPALGDERLRRVTVRHLLTHRAGWNSEIAGDLVFDEVEAARDMGLSSPPGRRNLARWILGHPLQFAPGKDFAYSNEGYFFLGLIIEKRSGSSYLDYVQSAVLDPAGIEPDDVRLGRTLRAHSHPREPWYDSGRLCRSVMDPETKVECAYGGWDLEGHISTGRLIASTDALLGFVDAYSIVGATRGLERDVHRPGNWSHIGGFSGTSALARERRDGIYYVVIFNHHAPGPRSHALEIRELLDRVIEEKIEEWPQPGTPALGRFASLR